MYEALKRDVTKFLYSFIGNTGYHNDFYYDSLVKKYGKKAVVDAVIEEREHGKITDAFGYD